MRIHGLTFGLVACAFSSLADTVSTANDDAALNAGLAALPASPATGAPCNPRRSGLDPLTHRFHSDCGYTDYCEPSVPSNVQANTTTAVSATGTCRRKGCRRDEFPFGYKGLDPPPMCPSGQYCPDAEDACKPVAETGSPCELNRDDACASPGDPGVLPVCLQGTCALTNAGLGEKCTVDDTKYIGYIGDEQVVNTVTRDNCMTGLYCGDDLVCIQEKALGDTCASDRECQSFNCGHDGKCLTPPEAPNVLKPWAFALIGVALSLALLATVLLLYRAHSIHRAARTEEIDRYFSEQWLYRQSILSMQAAMIEALQGRSVHHGSPDWYEYKIR